MILYRVLILSTVLFLSCRPVDHVSDTIDDDSVDTLGEVPVDTLVAVDINLSIDATKRTHKVSKNPAGVVSCWLMDSDKHRPRATTFSDAMKDMGVKYIRFPYGHLADNYLWDADGDWGNTLTPKVATFSQGPASWDWAVDSLSGEFIDDMDFDEYVSICTEVGAEPMVVVNILSYKYENGPTYEQLKASAVEWVRYANITKGYKVKRWALGNEVDHHPEFISQAEYKVLYADFAAAMKAVDPTILLGPGLLGNWHAQMLNYAPELIDFICVHNYLYKYDWRNQDYEGWKNATDIMVNNVEKCQAAVNSSSIPDTEIHVTEMNSRPWKDKSDNDDIFRALAYGEMLLNACSFEDVQATYVWNTHGPWGGLEENAPYNVLDLDNNREPRGEVMKIINENLFDYFLEVPRVNAFFRQYVTITEDNDSVKLILINKNNESVDFNIEITDSETFSVFSQIIYAGENSSDESPTYFYVEDREVEQNIASTTLKPLSINIFTFTK